MRKTFIALAAVIGVTGMGVTGMGGIAASAASVVPTQPALRGTDVQRADWYCGPRCEYWHHRRWEERHEWRRYNQPYYGYNYPYGYYYR